MKHITAELFEWGRYEPLGRLDRNGWFVVGKVGEPGVVVDPVPLNEGDREHIQELGGVAAVVLTGDLGDQAREAAWWQREAGCAVYAPEAAVKVLGEAVLTDVRGYKAWDQLPGGLIPIAVPNAVPEMMADAAQGEAARMALFHRGSRAWLVGSLLVGAPVGTLSLPAEVLEGGVERTAAAARGLRTLLGVWMERVLVGRGTSICREVTAPLQDVVYRHDPEAFVLRPGEATFGPPFEGGTGYGRRSAEYARLLGLKTLDFDLQEVMPGRRSTGVHRHDGEEEAFVILSGEGEVHVLPPGEKAVRRVPVAAGDVVAFPPRYQIAHSFKNTGTEPLRFFAFSALSGEAVGMIDYPLSGKHLEYTDYGKMRRYFLPERVNVPYFEGEPEG